MGLINRGLSLQKLATFTVYVSFLLKYTLLRTVFAASVLFSPPSSLASSLNGDVCAIWEIIVGL